MPLSNPGSSSYSHGRSGSIGSNRSLSRMFSPNKLVHLLRSPRRALFFLLLLGVLTLSWLNSGLAGNSILVAKNGAQLGRSGSGLGNLGLNRVRWKTDKDPPAPRRGSNLKHDQVADEDRDRMHPIWLDRGQGDGKDFHRASTGVVAGFERESSERARDRERDWERDGEEAGEQTADEAVLEDEQEDEDTDVDVDVRSAQDDHDDREEEDDVQEEPESQEGVSDTTEEYSDELSRDPEAGQGTDLAIDYDDNDEYIDEYDEYFEDFQWGDETGLRVLTEEDLYDDDDPNVNVDDSGSDIDLDADFESDGEADEVFFDESEFELGSEADDEEEESEEARQARIQVWRDQNRLANRVPLRDLPFDSDSMNDEKEDEQQPAWMEGLEEEMKDDGECRFESPVEGEFSNELGPFDRYTVTRGKSDAESDLKLHDTAYQRALTRLRKQKLAQMSKSVTDNDSGYEEEEVDVTAEDIERLSHPTLASHTLPDLPGAHKYSPTGHLVISTDEQAAEHPIPQLLKLGERRWEEMIGRQSRTLSEAVDEYKKRYGRAPPRGFDVW